jgi:hypothetical protein
LSVLLGARLTRLAASSSSLLATSSGWTGEDDEARDRRRTLKATLRRKVYEYDAEIVSLQLSRDSVQAHLDALDAEDEENAEDDGDAEDGGDEDDA